MMKITDIKIGIEELADGRRGIACRVVTDAGGNFGCAMPWETPGNLEATADLLRQFAHVIERMDPDVARPR